MKEEDVVIGPGDLIEYNYWKEWIDDDGYTCEESFESIGEVISVYEKERPRLFYKKMVIIRDLKTGEESHIRVREIKGILSRKQSYRGEEMTWFGEILREALEKRKENPRDK